MDVHDYKGAKTFLLLIDIAGVEMPWHNTLFMCLC